MAATANPVRTAEALLRVRDDSLRRELVRGELRVMSPAGARHGRLAIRAGRLLDAHAAETGAGVVFGAETGFVLARDPDTVRAPDAAFVSRERFEAVGDTEKYWPGAPDLAVEIVSPGDGLHEIQDKAHDWIVAGCIAVLVIDPSKRAVTVHRAGGETHIYGDGGRIHLNDVVPGLVLTVVDLLG